MRAAHAALVALQLLILSEAGGVPKKPTFPASWGKPPQVLTDGTDYGPLAGGYGNGGYGLSQWIKDMLKNDRSKRKVQYPPDFGQPPNAGDDYVELPFDYGYGDSALMGWLKEKAKSVYNEEAEDYKQYSAAMTVETMQSKPICALIDLKNISLLSDIDLINCNITRAATAPAPAPSPGAAPAPAKSYPESDKPEFPKAWGNPPTKLLSDKVPLPGGYGYGSSTLETWINNHMKIDKAARTLTFPPKWGAPPEQKKEDIKKLVGLPFGYGMGSQTLRDWINKNALAVYKEKNEDFIARRQELEKIRAKKMYENSQKWWGKKENKRPEREQRFKDKWERRECTTKPKEPEFPKSWGAPPKTAKSCHLPVVSKYHKATMEEFKKCDTDHDGVLSIKEFLACPAALRCTSNAAQPKTAMAHCDKDHDGKLTPEEFMKCPLDWRCAKKGRRLAAASPQLGQKPAIVGKSRLGKLQGWSYCNQGLAGGYGRGSPQLSIWIQQNIATDDKAGQPQYPPAFGDPPAVRQGIHHLPFGYGTGSKELADWLKEKAFSTYCEQVQSFERAREGMRTDHWLRKPAANVILA